MGATVTTPNTWILTNSRRRFDLVHPRAVDVHLQDIAFAAANLNRFTGHVGTYSVAEHCVHVVRRVRDLGGTIEEQLIAGLHDATEPYVNDASSPLKQAMRAMRPFWDRAATPMSHYDMIEFRVWVTVAEAFDLELDWSHAMPDIVKQADHDLVRIEAETLWGGADKLPADWGPLPVEPVENAERYRPLRWPPALAEARYLQFIGDLLLARAGGVVR
jgi:hypothetical protein